MFKSLLPPNATAFELSIERVLSNRLNIKNPIKTINNPDTASNTALDFLAYQNRVEVWQSDFTHTQKILAIRNSKIIHQQKGTVFVIKQILKIFGLADAKIQDKNYFCNGEIKAGGNQTAGELNQFGVYVIILAQPISSASAQKVKAAIQAVSPVRCHLINFDFSLNSYLADGSQTANGFITAGAL